ncbi:MAG TPA: S41 family peptidase [Faecalibacter sp.]
MKKYLYLLGFFSLFWSIQSCAQKKKPLIDPEPVESSQISISSLNKSQIQALDRLGRVWGFLKYHHPMVGEGKYDWDQELFRILTNYLVASTPQEQEKYLLDWIETLGEIPPCTSCAASSPEAVQRAHHDWINTSLSYEPLKQKLIEIYHNRYQGKHYYVTTNKGNGAVEFIHEKMYRETPYPDAATRLLALYRYWNNIQYFYPYKHLTDQSWDSILVSYIPKFIDASDELAYELVVLQLMAETNDSHAMIKAGNDQILKQKGQYYASFRGAFIEDQFIMVDDYQPQFTSSIGIQKGDRITRINGKYVEDMVKELTPYYPASNKGSYLRNLAMDLLRSNQSTMNITFESNGKSMELTIPLYPKDQLDYYTWYKTNPLDKGYHVMENNLGYISIAALKEKDILRLKKDLISTKGIIIDLRNYPNLRLPEELASYFVNDKVPYAKFSFPNVQHPGEFLVSAKNILRKQKVTYTGKVVVLVNEVTQSAAEFLAMALKVGPQTVIMGNQTAGADGNVISMILPGGIESWVSGLGVYYPDGRETQRIGIVPDIEVKPTRKGIQANRDEVLEAAIAYLK